MGVSATGSNLTFRMVRRLAVGVIAVFVVLAYLYGPPATPGMRDSAVAQCNDHAEGNFRSFRLSWHVGVYPHWSCWDASRPSTAPLNLGWWTNPLT
jgi:hypothetical protein